MHTGFVTLFGRSNVGKSTLLNRLVGTKLAITSPKPQTTRHHIQGVVHLPEGQVVFVDTPGFFTGARSALTKALNARAESGLHGVDLIAHVVDPTRAPGPEDKRLLAMVAPLTIPKVLVINKIDEHRLPYRDAFRAYASTYSACVEVSAKTGAHLKTLLSTIVNLLPEGEPVYPQDQLTNMDQKTWFAEIIREKLFLRLREEAPYALTVVADEAAWHDDTFYIAARILVSDARYKGMVIGKGGVGLREIGQSARRELEGVLQAKVYLDLQVEVDAHWMHTLENDNA